jgi:hypothetical protein
LAGPFWRGSAVTGALALFVPDSQMRYQRSRNRYVEVVMDAVADLSHHAPGSSRGQLTARDP